MEIDPTKLPHLYRDAHADLVPNTPLKDMQVNICPGDPAGGQRCRPGATIPVGADDLADRLRRAARRARHRHPHLVHEPDHRARTTAPSGRGSDIRALLHEPRPDRGAAAADRRPARRPPPRARRARPQPRRAQPGDQPQGRPAPDRCPGRAADDSGARQPGRGAARSRSPSSPERWPTTRTTLADRDRACPTSSARPRRRCIPTARRLPPTLRRPADAVPGRGAAAAEPDPAVRQPRSLPLAGAAAGARAATCRSSDPAADRTRSRCSTTSPTSSPTTPAARIPASCTGWRGSPTTPTRSSRPRDANGPAWRALLLTSCASLKSLLVRRR